MTEDCEATFITWAGSVVRCVRQGDHDDHEGFYPGDTRLSHWREGE